MAPQKCLLGLDRTHDLAVLLTVQMRGFCVSPVKRNEAGLWFLRRPDGSEPSGCTWGLGGGVGGGRWCRWPISSLRGPQPAGIGLCAETHFVPTEPREGQADP